MHTRPFNRGPALWRAAALAALLTGLVAGAARAETLAIRSFTPADLAASAPRTALDMLKQAPGFVIAEPDTERGLGQASGNVVVNGRRLSGKTQGVEAELGRIPIGAVVRIDIVDAASLDVPGLSGQVANVVVETAQAEGQFVWEPEVRAYYTTPNLAKGEVSVSGRLAAFDYTLALQNRANHAAAGGPTRVYGPDGRLVEVRDDVWRYEAELPRLSARVSHEGAALSGALSASYEKRVAGLLEKGVRRGPGLVDRSRRVGEDQDTNAYELGGELGYARGAAGLKLIVLVRGEHNPFESHTRTVFADGVPDAGDGFTQASEARERVLRGELRLAQGGGDWQLSLEKAFNSLDQATRLFTLTPTGAVAEIPLPNASARVEEDRYEAMLSYSRSLTPSLSIQVSAGGEYSLLAQAGAGGQERRFWRPKGLATAAWKAAPGLDLSLRLERKVGQLDFGDFLASVNVVDNRRSAGNPDLVPPQSWIAELEATRALGRYGVAKLKLYGRLIDDIIDTIPIGAADESLGNLDRAVVYGLSLNSTLNLDAVGLAGAKLDLQLDLEGSRVRDPLTGRIRPISDNLIRHPEIALRQDVPGSDWAWGAELSQWFYSRQYRLTEVVRGWDAPFWADVYVEHKDVLGLAVRFTIDNLLDAHGVRNRTVYAGRRTGPVAFMEERRQKIGPIFSLQVRGRF